MCLKKITKPVMQGIDNSNLREGKYFNFSESPDICVSLSSFFFFSCLIKKKIHYAYFCCQFTANIFRFGSLISVFIIKHIEIFLIKFDLSNIYSCFNVPREIIRQHFFFLNLELLTKICFTDYIMTHYFFNFFYTHKYVQNIANYYFLHAH